MKIINLNYVYHTNARENKCAEHKIYIVGTGMFVIEIDMPIGDISSIHDILLDGHTSNDYLPSIYTQAMIICLPSIIVIDLKQFLKKIQSYHLTCSNRYSYNIVDSSCDKIESYSKHSLLG